IERVQIQADDFDADLWLGIMAEDPWRSSRNNFANNLLLIMSLREVQLQDVQDFRLDLGVVRPEVNLESIAKLLRGAHATSFFIASARCGRIDAFHSRFWTGLPAT